MHTDSATATHVQGNELTELAERFGTPLFVYDSQVMQEQYERLHKAFEGVDLRINYACKALSNVNVLRLFRSLGAGLDTVSIQEVQLGLMAGFEPEQIIFTPNCIGFGEYEQAVAAGVRVNIDNLSVLEHFGEVYGDRYPVCIRLNPHIVAGGHQKISVGHIDSKFGISIHQLRHLERIIEHYKIRVDGLHMHTGSDILDVQAFLRGASLLIEAAAQFPDLSYIDFGSGFKVAYRPDDIETDIEEFGREMTRMFKDFCNRYGRPLQINFEPGKYLVSRAGYFLCRVNVVKQTTATVFAGVDSGFNHFIRPMFYEAYHGIDNLSNPAGRPRIYTVVGYICETDIFGWDRRIAAIREGDILRFHNAGAYVHAMSSNYNSRPRPAEVLVHQGSAHLISRAQTLEDITRNQVDLPELFSGR